MNLKGKTVLVTGSSSGIGKATALRFAKEGSNLILTYNSNKKGADDSAKEIENMGSRVLNIKVSMQSEENIKELFKKVKEEFGVLDILVNNAGVNTGGEPFDLNIWKSVFEIDLFSIVSCTGKAVELMKDGGKIINISSVYGEDKAAYYGLPAYDAAKAALNNFTRTMAKRLAPKILVNAVAPGYVITPIWGEMSEEKLKSNSAEQLIDRFIKPEEIADMVIAISKNDAMTGEVVVVDGGLSLKTV